jgi:hypothetical protein
VGDRETVNQLLANGFDVNSQVMVCDKTMPESILCSLRFVILSFSCAQDLVVPSLTPLHIAVQRNNIDLAKDLLSHRQIDANRCDQASVNKCK